MDIVSFHIQPTEVWFSSSSSLSAAPTGFLRLYMRSFVVRIWLFSLTDKSWGWWSLRLRKLQTRTRNKVWTLGDFRRWLGRSSWQCWTWEYSWLVVTICGLVGDRPAASVEDVKVGVADWSPISLVRKICWSLGQGCHSPVKVVSLICFSKLFSIVKVVSLNYLFGWSWDSQLWCSSTHRRPCRRCTLPWWSGLAQGLWNTPEDSLKLIEDLF